MSDVARQSGIDLAFGDVAGLDEVVDREALRDVCRSFFDLFGISVRVFSGSGALLADAHEDPAVHAYLRTLPGGRRALSESLDAVIRATPDQAQQLDCGRYSGAKEHGLEVARTADVVEVNHRHAVLDPVQHGQRVIAMRQVVRRIEEDAEAGTLSALCDLQKDAGCRRCPRP